MQNTRVYDPMGVVRRDSEGKADEDEEDGGAASPTRPELSPSMVCISVVVNTSSLSHRHGHMSAWVLDDASDMEDGQGGDEAGERGMTLRVALRVRGLREDPYFMLLLQFGSLLRREAFLGLLKVRDMSPESDWVRRVGRMREEGVPSVGAMLVLVMPKRTPTGGQDRKKDSKLLSIGSSPIFKFCLSELGKLHEAITGPTRVNMWPDRILRTIEQKNHRSANTFGGNLGPSFIRHPSRCGGCGVTLKAKLERLGSKILTQDSF
ncbi:hypothetical protein BJ165DRAFT_1411113 [Panaeolus papilionaceus]|nr:hypothetical protein BJ165DRAFT_1411113 [Panaeolus papilionaceus]